MEELRISTLEWGLVLLRYAMFEKKRKGLVVLVVKEKGFCLDVASLELHGGHTGPWHLCEPLVLAVVPPSKVSHKH